MMMSLLMPGFNFDMTLPAHVQAGRKRTPSSYTSVGLCQMQSLVQ